MGLAVNALSWQVVARRRTSERPKDGIGVPHTGSMTMGLLWGKEETPTLFRLARTLSFTAAESCKTSATRLAGSIAKRLPSTTVTRWWVGLIALVAKMKPFYTAMGQCSP